MKLKKTAVALACAIASCVVLPLAACAGNTAEPCEHSYLSFMISEPTCTGKGLIEQTCKKCGEKIYSDIEALGHDFVDGTCTRCGISDGTAEEPGPSCEHDFVGSVVVLPSCTEKGRMVFECEKCGEKIYSDIEALGHDFVDGTCTRCGVSDGTAEEPDLSLFTDMYDAYVWAKELGYPFTEETFTEGLPGMRFTDIFVNKNGRFKVKYGWISADIGDVRVDIPVEEEPELRGSIAAIEVTGDGDVQMTDTTGVVKNFGRIEQYATIARETLTGVALNMQNCLLLLTNRGRIINAGRVLQNNSPDVSDDLLLYSELNDGTYQVCGAFDRNIKSADIAPTHMGARVMSVGIEAFSGYACLENVTVPEGVTHIKRHAFKDCTALKYAILPQSLESLHLLAFENCRSLKSIFYMGTEEQWKNVTENSNYFLEDVAVYYYGADWELSDGKPIMI